MPSATPTVWFADLLASVLPCAPQSQAAPCLGENACRGNALWDGATSTLRLAGASKESLFVQLVLEKEAGSLKSLKLVPAGGVRPRLSLWANVSSPHDGIYHDDALVPLHPADAAGMPDGAAALLDIPGRERRTYTVELAVPAGAPAGRHDAQMLVERDGGSSAVRVELTVFGFELPAETPCTADLNAYGVAIGRGWPGVSPASARYVAIEREFFRMAHDHRAVFHILPYAHSGRIEAGYVPLLSGRGRDRRVSDWRPFDDRWGQYLDGTAFKGTRRGARPIGYLYLPVNLNWPAYFENYGTPAYETEFKNVLRDMAEHFARKRWTRTKFEVFFNHKARWKYFPWDMDEIRFERDNRPTLQFARMANEAVAGIKGPQFVNRIDSSWIFGKSARSELGDVIDLWIVNGSYAAPFPDEAALLRQKGQEVWFYGGAGVIASPTRLDNLRWPWIAWGRDVDGFTWWNAIGWSANPLQSPGKGWDFAMYPGGPLGLDCPLPSLRLKAMLRGMQDHAYLSELTRRTGSRAAAEAIVAEHLGCSRGREDWWQRGEYPGISGSEIRSHKFSDRPWKSAPVPAWQSCREAVGRAIESARQGS